ncbi:hypothetical protein MP228_000747 [Amoeboaphelidium protococcarum]|nr:hypothetical protein MP228_000747 [Amoeboaphelidium protococcarum]
MASKAAHKRLMKEYQQIQASPPPLILAKPLEKNVLEWHYVITGAPETPFFNGEYHGKLVFPSDYPFKPPSITMITPSGRFQPNAKICLTMSDFHPELWNPSWSVASILLGLQSFMNDESQNTTGSVTCSLQEKKQFARMSRKWNRESNPKFVDVFPELAKESAEFPQQVSGSKQSQQAVQVDNKEGQMEQDMKVHDILDRDVGVGNLINVSTIKLVVVGLIVGIGLGLCELFAEYAEQHQDCQCNIFLVCRNQTKTQEAIRKIHRLYPAAVQSDRLKMLALKGDLCDVDSIKSVASLLSKKCDRIDLLYCNAGVLLIDGIDFYAGVKTLLTNPSKFFTDVSATLKQSVGVDVRCNNTQLGKVFMANVLGHYALMQSITELLQGGRVIWTGSRTADKQYFDPQDIDAIRSKHPYESSKIVTEHLSWYINNSEQGFQSYIADPGVVNTQIVSSAMSWIISALLITPVLYIASFFISSVTYTLKIGAISLFHLSGLSEDASPDQYENVNPAYKYSSNFSMRKGGYVTKKLLDIDQDIVDESVKFILESMNKIM